MRKKEKLIVVCIFNKLKTVLIVSCRLFVTAWWLVLVFLMTFLYLFIVDQFSKRGG